MTTDQFQPDILGFSCNWCGYAGADLAGLNKLEYPPIKFIRINCLGTLDMLTVLKGFKKQYDGVLLVGCHIGDCHFISGNVNCHREMEKLKKLLDLIGVDPRRLRVEEVSSAEATKFAEVVTDFWEEISQLGPSPLIGDPEEILESHQAHLEETSAEPVDSAETDPDELLCIQCGKCEASCPVFQVNPTFSPKRVQMQLKLGQKETVLRDNNLWKCLTCNTCGDVCASSTPWVEHLKNLRIEAQALDIKPQCKHGSLLDTVYDITALPWIQPDRKAVFDGCDVAESGEVLLFGGCSPIFDTVFDFCDSSSTIRSAVRLMNQLGTTPAVLGNEKCCGFDSMFRGNVRQFEQLRNHNLAAIENAAPKVIYTTCAECYYALTTYYRPLLKNQDIRIHHFSTWMAEHLDQLRFRTMSRSVTYHDACRLGRYSGEYDAVRKLLGAIPGVDMSEMERHHAGAACCGVGNFVTCDKDTKFLQHKRLMEAQAAGDYLITSCPKCKIHFSCYLDGKPVEPIDLEGIIDITEFVLEAVSNE